MPKRSERGFTLTELLITIGIFSIMVAASWGNFQSLIRQHRLTGATNQLTTHLRLAREKAVAEGNNYIVTFRVNLDNYQVWDDEGNDAVFGAAEGRTNYAMPTGTTLSNAAFFGGNRIIFRPDGTSSASGSVQVGNGENTRSINILASTGKVTVTSP